VTISIDNNKLNNKIILNHRYCKLRLFKLFFLNQKQ
jgi:hypothetical protein